jgi:type IV pilus assembly protein PilY1
MKPLRSALAIMTLALLGAWMNPSAAQAQANADYTSTPPFVNDIAVPNILIIMDNSGSMENRACESTSCGITSTGAVSTVTTFDATTRYSGFADPMKCYTWDTTDKRFESLASPSTPANTVKTALNTACGTGEWDGNFVNWVSFRRFDAVKKAMSGGNCYNPTLAAGVSVRNTDGTCKPYGTPSMTTVRMQNTGTSTETTPAVPKTGTNVSYIGRIPSSVYSASNPANLYFQIQSTGDLCVDDDNSGGCPDSGGFTETILTAIAFATPSEPTGVIQQVGAKARFGLAVFNGGSSDDGMKVLTPIGAKQSIDFSGSVVETFTTNTAAMIDSVDESFPATWTPLAETLYDAVRYVAQINSAYYPTSYVYPIAFSDTRSKGVAYQTNGIGSLGAGGSGSSAEEKVLTGTETCPAGYIANACGRDPYFFGSNHTPAWASTSQVVNCCKTFVVIFTDGEPTQDQNIPSTLQDVAHAYHGVHCTGSDAAAPPRPVDSTCNTNEATPFSALLGEHKTDYADNGSGYLDSVAYWAHVNDMRPCSGTSDAAIAVIGTIGHCLPGTQNVSTYTFFAFGNINGRGILSQTAKVGAFDDANGDGIPQTGEWDKENNYTGVATPDGIPDAYFESSNVDDLQDKLMATISSIIRRSSSGAAVSVLATSSTGEGSLYQAYFYPSTLEEDTNNDVKWTGYTQSFFVDTFGNLREDTNADGRQDYKVDLIIKTRLSAGNLVLVDKYQDNDGNGLADDLDGDGVITLADCVICGKVLSDIKPIWEAGKQLALKSASSRTIRTWVDGNHNGVVDSGEQMDFSTANSGTLGPYLRAGAAPYTADAIINFIRGCEVTDCSEQAGLRDRRLQVPPGSHTLKLWKLGDVINAPPTVVAAPRDRYDVTVGDDSYNDYFTKYRTRRQMVYVGGNDGMLHAFNGGFYHPGDDTSPSAPSVVTEHGWFTKNPNDNTSGPPLGDEMWGFVPYELLPYLQWLTRQDYQHVYYVDLPPVVKDVRIFPNDADHPNGWGTVLIGGFRMGGSCQACTPAGGAPTMTVNISGTNYNFYSAYFVLDITNPEVAPKLLWSFSKSDLGLTTSVPSVVRVNPTAALHTDNTSAKWFMVVGSGPTGYDGRSGQISKLFVVNMATGPGSANSLVNTLIVGNGDATGPAFNGYGVIGDMKAVDRNLDYRTDVVYFGRAMSNTMPWHGKIYRLALGTILPFGGATDPNNWGVAGTGAAAGYRQPTEILDYFDTTTFGSSTVQMGPVLAAPATAVDDASKLWVFVGSGRYFSNSDKTDTSTQYFVGVKDKVMNNGCTLPQTSTVDCWANVLVDVSAAQVCVVGVGNCGQTSGTNQVTGVSGVSTMAQLMTLVGSKDGWVTKLLPASGPGVGERVLSAPTVFGGIVFFPTFTPTNDICASTGTSNLYALFYKTGGPYQEPIIGTTAGAGGVANVNRSTSLGSGMAFGAVPYVGSGADGTSPYKLFINTSSGSLSPQEVNLAIDPRSHFASWINM